MATNVYIDGFNLYYGCLKDSPYRWLDLEAFCREMLPRDEIQTIRYFTAKVKPRGDGDQVAARQRVYLRALGTMPSVVVHYGHFLSHTTRMPLAHRPDGGPRTVEVIKTEEKGSDVNLATHLLMDAFDNACDVAVVVSNDGDLKEPMRMARDRLGTMVGVINPHAKGNKSQALSSVCNFYKAVRTPSLRRSQLPTTMSDRHGSFHKPNSW